MSMEPITYYLHPWRLFESDCAECMNERDSRSYYFLWHRYYELREVWTELAGVLSATPVEREILQKHLSCFTRRATDAMWRELILGIVAYFDGFKEDRGAYMSLPSLTMALDHEKRQALKEMLKGLKEDVLHLNRVRGNHVAHNQYGAIALRDLSRVEREHIENGLKTIEQGLHEVATARNLPLPPPTEYYRTGGADALFAILKAFDQGRQ